MSVTTEAALQKAGQETPEHLQRNYWLGVTSGIAYNVYTVVLNTQLVVVWFLSELTTSNLLISLAFPIGNGSWFFMQFLLSGYVQRKPRTMPLYRQVAVLRIVVSGLLVLAAFTLDNPQALLIVFLLVFTINSVASGVAALPFLNVVAKTIPARRRGMYFAWRRFGGGLLGLLAGVWSSWSWRPTRGCVPCQLWRALYRGLFAVGPAGRFLQPGHRTGGSRGPPSREPVGTTEARPPTAPARPELCPLPGRPRGLCRVYLRAAVLRRLCAARVNAPEDTVGTYVLALTLATIFGNLVLGLVGDRRGNRLLVRIAAFTAMLPALTALVIALLPGIEFDTVLLFSIVFLFQGLHTAAAVLGAGNYLLELCPSSERVLYIGLTYGIVGLAWFTLPLGSAIVDYFGFEPLFAVSLVAGLIAAVFSLSLEEPRDRETPASAEGIVGTREAQSREGLGTPA